MENFVCVTVVIKNSENRTALLRELKKDSFNKVTTSVYQRICKNKDSAISHIDYLDKLQFKTKSDLLVFENEYENIHLKETICFRG